MQVALLYPNLIYAFVAGFVCAIFLFAILGRAPGLFLPLMRLFSRPVSVAGRLLRRFKFVKKIAKRGRKAGAAAAEGGIEARRTTIGETEIEHALHIPDDGASDPKTRHDFAEEESLLHRRGFWFRSIGVPAEYLPDNLIGPLSDEIAEQYTMHAKKFFSHQVSLDANSDSLYEDSEGNFIISLFRETDRRCYYVLNEMRKVINDNARRLVFLLTVILAGWTGCAAYVFHDITGHGSIDVNAHSNELSMLAFLWMVSIVVCVLAQIAGYKQQQQHTSRELRFFLTKYLGRIADRYRESTGKAKQVTVGEETDAKKLAESAQKWHKIMVWTPFRTFFIECFVRNTLYQVRRNCQYYLWIPPVSLVIIFGGVLWCAMSSAAHLPAQVYGTSAFWILAGALAAMFFILVGVYRNRIYSVVLWEELTHLDWLGYDNLDVSAAMDEVVGKYAEEVGFWKERLKYRG